MSIVWEVTKGASVIGSVTVLWAIVFLLIAWFFQAPRTATWYDTNEPDSLDERGPHD